MKKLISTVAALSLTTFGAAVPQVAHADDFGCTVLLCLANPNGPMAVAECVAPIQRLYRMIFSWRPQPFPTCVMSSGLDSTNTGNFARVGAASYYDACPAGMTALDPGMYATTGAPAGMISAVSASTPLYTGIGEGYGLQPTVDSPLPAKVCVGNMIGSTQTNLIMQSDGMTGVGVYDNVVVINPAPTTFNVEVYINGMLNKVVRP